MNLSVFESRIHAIWDEIIPIINANQIENELTLTLYHQYFAIVGKAEILDQDENLDEATAESLVASFKDFCDTFINENVEVVSYDICQEELYKAYIIMIAGETDNKKLSTLTERYQGAIEMAAQALRKGFILKTDVLSLKRRLTCQLCSTKKMCGPKSCGSGCYS